MSSVVTILFIAANLFGPWVCCCTVAAVVPPPQVAEKIEPECSECPHCKKKEEPKPVEKHPIKNCPCEARPQIEMTAADCKPNTIISLLHLPLPEVIAGEPIVVSPSILAIDKARGPVFTAEIKLYHHHVLRC